jgi:TRAP-type C4-dicarboxylate transport system substrate-binding protein
MPFAEVYSGLQLKMIDGQENPDYYIYSNKLFQVQDYIIIAKHAVFMNATIVNQKFFDSLPKDIQKMIVDTVNGMYEWAEDWGAKFNADAVDKMLKERPDFKVIRLTEEQRKPFAQAAASVREDYINLMEDKALARKLLNAIVQEVADAEKSVK